MVQRRLLPQRMLEIEGYDLAGACVPAQEVAGDFYDWVVPQPGVVDVTVADVMARGIGAALVMATLRAALRAAAPQLGPAARLSRVADALGLEAEEPEFLVRVFHGRLEVATGRLRYVDAGHGYCSIRRPDGQLVSFTDRSLPLGVGGQPFVEGVTELPEGHCLIACTDGLLKAHEHVSTLADLTSVLGESNDATEVANALMSGTPPRPEDDAAVLTLYRRERSGAAPPPPSSAVQSSPSLVMELECHQEPSAQLDAIHQALRSCWERMPVRPDDAWRMRFELAVAEVAANVIEHARPATMSFRLEADRTCVTAEFRYEGPGWTDAGRLGQGDLLAERGRGLFLAKTAIDDLGYQRKEGVVRWRLRKRL